MYTYLDLSYCFWTCRFMAMFVAILMIMSTLLLIIIASDSCKISILQQIEIKKGLINWKNYERCNPDFEFSQSNFWAPILTSFKFINVALVFLKRRSPFYQLAFCTPCDHVHEDRLLEFLEKLLGWICSTH